MVKNNAQLSKSLKKRLSCFSQYSEELKQYIVPSILISQLGKNDAYSFLIQGDKLLHFAFDEIRKVQNIIGGKFVYLECEDKERLKDFYKDNGFLEFGKRELELDEQDSLTGSYLIQMLKYLR